MIIKELYSPTWVEPYYGRNYSINGAYRDNKWVGSIIYNYIESIIYEDTVIEGVTVRNISFTGIENLEVGVEYTCYAKALTGEEYLFKGTVELLNETTKRMTTPLFYDLIPVLGTTIAADQTVSIVAVGKDDIEVSIYNQEEFSGGDLIYVATIKPTALPVVNKSKIIDGILELFLINNYSFDFTPITISDRKSLIPNFTDYILDKNAFGLYSLYLHKVNDTVNSTLLISNLLVINTDYVYLNDWINYTYIQSDSDSTQIYKFKFLEVNCISSSSAIVSFVHYGPDVELDLIVPSLGEKYILDINASGDDLLINSNDKLLIKNTGIARIPFTAKAGVNRLKIENTGGDNVVYITTRDTDKIISEVKNVYFKPNCENKLSTRWLNFLCGIDNIVLDWNKQFLYDYEASNNILSKNKTFDYVYKNKNTTLELTLNTDINSKPVIEISDIPNSPNVQLLYPKYNYIENEDGVLENTLVYSFDEVDVLDSSSYRYINGKSVTNMIMKIKTNRMQW